MAIKLLIIDLDDTLINTSRIYINKIEQFCSLMSSLGFSEEVANKMFKDIDSSRMMHEGVRRQGFPTSMVKTYENLCRDHGRQPEEEIKKACFRIGDSVFQDESETFDFAEDVLRDLSKEYEMVVLTRGEKDVQTRRALNSGLIEYFDNIFVTYHKSADLYKRICRFYGANEKESLMVGDSFYGDIIGALEAGLFAFYITNDTSLIDPSSITPSMKRRLITITDFSKFPEALKTIVE